MPANVRIYRTPPDRIVVEGDLTASDAEAVRRSLSELPPTARCVLDLSDLEILDGVSVAEMVNAIRAMREHTGQLVILRAPQMLGHNLYRVGMLEGPNPVQLEELRSEEPYG